MNVFDLVMQMELDSKEHYEKLGEAAPVAGLKKVFSMLAASELKHYHAVKSIKINKPVEMADIPDHTTDLEHSKTSLSSLQVDDELLARIKTTLDALRHAMKVEEDSIRLYEDIIKTQQHHISNIEVVPILLKIIAEEKKHFDVVQNIHEIIEKFENGKVLHKFGKHREI